jgi:hypothetical protein
MKKIDIYSVKSNRECMKATVKPEMQQQVMKKDTESKIS